MDCQKQHRGKTVTGQIDTTLYPLSRFAAAPLEKQGEPLIPTYKTRFV